MVNSKYHNKHIEIDGINFSSKKEASRYFELKLLLKAGVISDLELQPEFELQPKYIKNKKTIRAIKYIADFRYNDEKSNLIIEDVKSSATFKTDVYKLKKKMFEYKYPLTITEIY